MVRSTAQVGKSVLHGDYFLVSYLQIYAQFQCSIFALNICTISRSSDRCPARHLHDIGMELFNCRNQKMILMLEYRGLERQYIGILKKADDKTYICKFSKKKKEKKRCIVEVSYWKFKDQRANNAGLDLRCLPTQPFSFSAQRIVTYAQYMTVYI